MEGAERERIGESPLAHTAKESTPEEASPHVVLEVVEAHEPVPATAAQSSAPRLPPPPPTPTPRRERTTEGSPPPPPSPQNLTEKPHGKSSNTASTSASDSDVKPYGKASPPPPPPPPIPSKDGNPGVLFSTAPPPPPPPPPPTRRGLTTPRTTVLNTSHRPASEVSSRSAPSPPNSSSTNTDLSEDEDTEFKLLVTELANIKQALEKEIRVAKKLRNGNEIQRMKHEIELRKWGEKMDSLEDEIARKEQDLREAKLQDREKSLKYRKDALENPLLLQEDQTNKNKDDDVWDKRQNIMAISLACGLSVLISMQPLFPPEYLKWIVGLFAIVWSLSTIAFPAGLFGTYRFEKDFSRHVSRLTFMSFAIFVIYILYILSQSPAPQSSDITPSPTPQPSVDVNTVFYGGLGVVTLIGHIVLWIFGCVTGGDKDP